MKRRERFYVIANEKYFWLFTIATNRKDCWAKVKKYCTTDNPQKEVFAQGGYKCVAVRLEEIKNK